MVADRLLAGTVAERCRRLGHRAGTLARRCGSGLFSYSTYGYDAFRSFGLDRFPRILLQVHPHPIAVSKILAEDLNHSEFGKDSLRSEEELCCDPLRFEELSKEALLADYCIVTSNFTKRTLVEAGVSLDRIFVVPYGVDAVSCPEGPSRDGTFRVVFVGQMVQRKGLEYLFRAWRKLRLKDAELVLAGRGRLDDRLLSAFSSEFKYLGPLTDAQLAQLYSQSDMFCMPSLVEGFGLVYLEAMSCGLPVIATPNTGVADIVQDGREGFIVPIRDVDSLAGKLEWTYRNRKALQEMRSAARTLAQQYSWSRFRDGIVSALADVEIRGARED
jgi:glycosyltransferase involved in cell wall biosynthesis